MYWCEAVYQSEATCCLHGSHATRLSTAHVSAFVVVQQQKTRREETVTFGQSLCVASARALSTRRCKECNLKTRQQ